MTDAVESTRRAFLGTALTEAALLATPRRGMLPNEFFALDTAVVRHLGKDLVQEGDIETLAALGYAGLAPVVPDPAAWQHLIQVILPALDARKLKLYAIYCTVQVSREGYSYNPELKRSLGLLKGRGTVVWLPLRSDVFQPSDLRADSLAVAAVQEIADLAAAQGLAVSLYPHAGSLAERVSDVVRIAEKSRRANAGVTFNLCHWLRTDGGNGLAQTLKLAMPRLSLVTINGADRDTKDWIRLIEPLDSGTYDVAGFLLELYRQGYRGPIGLQGYDVASNYHIEPRENLRRSMAAWKKLRSNRLFR